MIEIRILRPGDEAVLSRVALDVFDDPIVESSAWEFHNDPRHRLVVAIDDDLVVGFVSAVIYIHPDKSAPEMWINEVSVAPTHQGQGISRWLMQQMLKEAKGSGCQEAWVLTERRNDAAKGLYKSVGGIEGEPDTVMFTFAL